MPTDVKRRCTLFRDAVNATAATTAKLMHIRPSNGNTPTLIRAAIKQIKEGGFTPAPNDKNTGCTLVQDRGLRLVAPRIIGCNRYRLILRSEFDLMVPQRHL